MLLIIGSCQNEDVYLLEIKVLSPDNLPISGALVDVLEDSRRIASTEKTKSTTTDGLVRFNLQVEKKYYIYLTPNQAYSDKYIGNSEATYIYAGTFKTQEDIDNSPGQIPVPKVGDIKYFDINGDGVINESDLIIPISSSSSDKVIKTNLYLKNK